MAARPDRLKTALPDNKASPNEVLHARADNTSRAADFLSRQLEWLSRDPEMKEDRSSQERVLIIYSNGSLQKVFTSVG